MQGILKSSDKAKAYIFKLLWSTIQPSTRCLPLTEPKIAWRIVMKKLCFNIQTSQVFQEHLAAHSIILSGIGSETSYPPEQQYTAAEAEQKRVSPPCVQNELLIIRIGSLPPTKLIGREQFQSVCNWKCSHTSKDLPSMWFISCKSFAWLLLIWKHVSRPYLKAGDGHAGKGNL